MQEFTLYWLSGHYFTLKTQIVLPVTDAFENTILAQTKCNAGSTTRSVPRSASQTGKQDKEICKLNLRVQTKFMILFTLFIIRRVFSFGEYYFPSKQ